MNVVVLRGTLPRAPEVRDLPGGGQVVAFDLAVVGGDGTPARVPVAWSAPDRTLAALASGVEVLVTGEVRRRFFRAGGATQSRTEVVAAAVVPTRRPRGVASALEAARQALAGPCPAP